MSDYISEILYEKVKASKFVSISTDESKDVDDQSQLILTFKFMNCLQVIETFGHVFNIPNKTGETIFKTIHEYLITFNLHENLISVATDGGSAMVGKNFGFIAYFKKFKPKCVFFHCLAHRLMIGLTDVIEEDKDIKLLCTVIYNLTTYFKGSQNRIKLFNEFQIKNDEDNYPLHLTKPYDIRWISNFTSNTKILETYDSIINSLNFLKNNDTVALGLFITMKKFETIILLGGFTDVLAIIAHLTETLQKSDILISKINVYIRAAIQNIKNMFILDNFEGFWSSQIKEQVLLKKSYKGIDVDFDDVNIVIQNFNIKMVKISDLIIENLNSRFIEDLDLRAFDMFDFNKILYDKNIPKNFGLELLKDMIDYFNYELKFKYHLDTANTIKEYSIMKERLKELFNNNMSDNVASDVLFYLKANESEFPNLINIIDYMNCLLITSVECERLFSFMNLIKTKIRNRMESDLLNYLMMTKSNWKIVETDRVKFICKCIDYWNNVKKRYFYKKPK